MEATGQAELTTIVKKLKTHQWKVPAFQRDFVWSVASVRELGESLCRGRPIGIITVWTQKKGPPQLELRPVSLPPKNVEIEFTEPDVEAATAAILDGRQRCTAICCIFAGLMNDDGRSTHSHRYFLKLTGEDVDSDWVAAVPKTKLKTKIRDLTTDAGALSAGFAPLVLPKNGNFLSRLVDLQQMLFDPGIYPDNTLPSAGELEIRKDRLRVAFDALVGARIPYFTIPADKQLKDICDIFETLNTTGTRVSTVDLLHSILFSDGEADDGTRFSLRDAIKELGSIPTLDRFTKSWSRLDDRPELVLQMATACYIASEDPKRPAPRGGGSFSEHRSIKAADLLATPVAHWLSFYRRKHEVAEFLRDFQRCVLNQPNAAFSRDRCPYPATVTIYLALRWHLTFDPGANQHGFSTADIDTLYRAFFWRNALTERYNQGFLTKVGSDIAALKRVLLQRAQFETQSAWMDASEAELVRIIGEPVPDKESLAETALTDDTSGALRQALLLPLVALPKRDLLLGEDLLETEAGGDKSMEIHHIIPKAWFKKNKASDTVGAMIGSPANLMPLSRKSNGVWKDKKPTLALEKVSSKSVESTLASIYISIDMFEQLKSQEISGDAELTKFLEARAMLVADQVLSLTRLNA
jgi:hypothetical protein